MLSEIKELEDKLDRLYTEVERQLKLREDDQRHNKGSDSLQKASKSKLAASPLGNHNN